jgi:glycosyltransferase involved in cell wall biosynthesis
MPNRFFNLKLPREKMPGLYRAADVFLHMSMIESSANAYIEALATGLPIVTHDRLVTRWTLEDTSILVNTESEDEVVQGIHRALLSRDPHHIEARRRLAENRFAWSAIANQYAAFFQKTVAAHSQTT